MLVPGIFANFAKFANFAVWPSGRLLLDSSTPRLKHDWQPRQSAQERGVAPAHLITGYRQREFRHARKQRGECDLTLQTRQRSAETGMDTGAERDVTVRLPRDIEHLWIGKLLLIVIGRGQQRHNLLAASHALAAELGIVADPASETRLDRTVVAEHLLDRGLDETRVLLKPGTLLRVLEQRQRAITNQVHRRLVSRHNQQKDHREQLVLRQLVSLGLGQHQPAQEIVTWIGVF